MSDIKRCPFCNAEMKINHELMRYGSAVVHPDTDCVMVSLAFEINGWDKRPIEEKLESDNAALRESYTTLYDANIEFSEQNLALRALVAEMRLAIIGLCGYHELVTGESVIEKYKDVTDKVRDILDSREVAP